MDRCYEFDKDCLEALIIVFRDTQEIYFDEDNVEEQSDLRDRIQQSLLQISALSQTKLVGKYYYYNYILDYLISSY